jgi:hypothetical protein
MFFNSAMKLFQFLKVENIQRKHWNDNVGWEIAQVMHHIASLQLKKLFMQQGSLLLVVMR